MMIEFQEEYLAPASNDDLMRALAKFISIVGTHMSENRMQDWLIAVGETLQQFPHALCLEALRLALTELDDERKLIPFVAKHVGNITHLRERLDNTRKLLVLSTEHLA